MSQQIKKAVITAAGRGTRFLPASKAFQKELVPVMHKPQIQWVIEEAIEAGIEEIAVVVRDGVNTLEQYLEDDIKLENFLRKADKEDLLSSWKRVKENVNIKIFKQKESDPYGNGTPFILTKDFTKDDPFVAMLGDDIMIQVDKQKPNCVAQLMNYYQMYQPRAVMATVKVPRKEIHRYGSYEFYKKNETKVPYQIKSIIEKPSPNEAPSLFANSCRYVLTKEVVEEIEKKEKGKDGEIWLTDAVSRLAQKGEVIMATPFVGSIWVPVGDPLRWLKANILTALNSEKYADDVKKLIKRLQDKSFGAYF